jgi:hypothetical protein
MLVLFFLIVDVCSPPRRQNASPVGGDRAGGSGWSVSSELLPKAVVLLDVVSTQALRGTTSKVSHGFQDANE